MNQPKEKKSMQKEGKRALRRGYTTGSCAAAASKGAVLALFNGTCPASVELQLPIGEKATFQVNLLERTETFARCSVIKDAGDDPDVTHGAEIVAEARRNDASSLKISGGVGVGHVTKPGLGLKIGEPAINPVPRKMIAEAVHDALRHLGKSIETCGTEIIISVPDGEQRAKKTLNERLGIIGGLSILGTKGIVIPYSTKAYKHCIDTGVDVAKAHGCKTMVLTTGGRSEKWAMKILGLRVEAYIQMADYVGYAVESAFKGGAERLIIAAMPGKLAKLSTGTLQTHARAGSLDMREMVHFAYDIGLRDKDLLRQIEEANTARHLYEILLPEAEIASDFWKHLARKAADVAAGHIGYGIPVEALLLDFEGNTLARETVEKNDA